MLKLLADENFPGPVVRGLMRLRPAIDLLHVQDIGLTGADDPTMLAWAADNNRIVLSLDRATLGRHADDRVRRGQFMPGVFLFNPRMSYRQVIDEILVVEELTNDGYWMWEVIRFPL